MYPFLNMLYQNNILYYSDTDSIILDYEKGKPLVEKRIHPLKIGFFKIESESNLGYFLDKKFYYIKINQDGSKYILKTKGIDSKKLPENFSESIEKEFERIKVTLFIQNLI